ncbi:MULTISPECIES: ABC transporter permease [Anaerotruncus]|uniref:ABC transporter permease n=2 Tax=Anaerotruncus TaxID=244127 RepID=A0A498CNK8_9FIRM|nr:MULTISPECIES: ABC transporter permease [Anaerotruncus]MBC3938954.1 ABC transporter permease [Anaerotruncus massiliensis (ex Togo et al. 2019)]MCQ4896439.1 ABC transporter permease [Anaerotruncus sp. DFI.9.16]RLL10654.1 ABC transporter permease [Anaerotruncus massiliensis (ex Liu et al. 2021)]
MLNNILLAINITLMYSAPLIFAALGGVITQRSGVDNIGIEGMMTIGAFVATAVGYFTGSPWLGFLIGGLAGAAMAVLHAVASIHLQGNQTISGVAINFIGLGLALFLSRLFFDGATQTQPVPKKLPKILSLLGMDTSNLTINAINIDITVPLAILLTVAMWFFLYKTKWGLRVLACGEHPAAADSLGVNIYVIRYVCCILSGLLAGFGGAAMTLAVVSNFSPTVISGHGFIALAAVIFGKWTPQGALRACLLFGFAQAMVVMLGGMEYIPSQLLAMLPYVLTMVVLVLFVGRSEAPKANGTPYRKGER